jgi:hypothetical protein
MVLGLGREGRVWHQIAGRGQDDVINNDMFM